MSRIIIDLDRSEVDVGRLLHIRFESDTIWPAFLISIELFLERAYLIPAEVYDIRISAFCLIFVCFVGLELTMQHGHGLLFARP